MKIALAKAEKYVADKKLDVTKLSLSRICRRESIKNPKQNCWTIIWSPKKHHISGDELRVYIYDDGRIEHGRAS